LVTETTSSADLDAQVRRAVANVLKNISRGETRFWQSARNIIFGMFIIEALTSIISGTPLFTDLLLRSGLPQLVSFSILATVAISAFASMLFSFIFEDPPFTLMLRGALESKVKSQAMVDLSDLRRGDDEVLTVTPFVKELVVEEKKEEALSSYDPRQLMALYGESTSKLAERIFKRSNAHLFAGGVIAAIGIGVFLYRSSQISAGSEWKEILRVLAPGFGILFFIELVAFFFLRQYRSAMDDFRYFDAVRRSREESLVILKMFAENPNEVSTTNVLAAMTIYSSAGKLGKDETTEMLEVRKMQRDESVVFEKLAETLGALKELKSGEKK
jgi:hypothetical protein